MNYSIVDQWQETDGTVDATYDYRKLYGLKGYMKGRDIVTAIFGQFESDGRHIVHSTYNGDSEYGFDDNYSVSEFLDDVAVLVEGNVTYHD